MNLRKQQQQQQQHYQLKILVREKRFLSTSNYTVNYLNILFIFFIDYPAARKAFLIGVVLVALNQLNGSFTMLNYTATIFKESGSNLTPNMSAIVIGTIQVIGTIISTSLVEKAGRKVL